MYSPTESHVILSHVDLPPRNPPDPLGNRGNWRLKGPNGEAREPSYILRMGGYCVCTSWLEDTFKRKCENPPPGQFPGPTIDPHGMAQRGGAVTGD